LWIYNQPSDHALIHTWFCKNYSYPYHHPYGSWEMSAITVDTMVKTPVSSSPTIQSPMTPAWPISPTSAETIVELHQDNPIAVLNIAKGLTATI
jgi:hypothetical protein